MGKIIVIEGTDSSGKETQSEILEKNLKLLGINVKKISFPNYKSPACEPVKMYLAGEFGTDPGKINPYPISMMYAIDRYASFKQDWGKFYDEGGVIVTDRYTTSNMVHQASKIEDKNEKIKYLNWLEDLEYNKIAIPKPDMVIFLNMPTEFAEKLMLTRKNKITGENKKDIHEQDLLYLKKSHKNACEIAKRQGWQEILCVNGEKIKTIDEISEEILSLIKELV
ncbi:MAG: dTMP kinase [Fusobacteriaceae bacterium]